MGITKDFEQRITEKQKQLDEMLERAKKYQAELRGLQNKKKEEERRQRTHRLVEVGATVESVIKCPIQKNELPKLLAWLEEQEKNDRGFSKVLAASTEAETLEDAESGINVRNDDSFNSLPRPS